MNRNSELIEAAAQIIYDAFPFDGCGTSVKPAWVPNGNSLMQDRARDAAQAVIALTPEQSGNRFGSEPIDRLPGEINDR